MFIASDDRRRNFLNFRVVYRTSVLVYLGIIIKLVLLSLKKPYSGEPGISSNMLYDNGCKSHSSSSQ